MSESDNNIPGSLHPDTLAVRAGQERSAQMEHSEALYPTSSFVFRDAAEAAARFAGESPGNIYSRFTNPTVRMFEKRLAALEGGEACVGTASGMSAVLATCMALLGQGDHIVAAHGLFGTTTQLFDNHLSRFGIEVDYVHVTDLAAWRKAVRPGRTRMLFLETPTNPLTEVADIAALAQIAAESEALLVVDNCFCTPALQQPLALGADLVIHSATKYLDGQGRCVGGAIVGNQTLVGEQVYGFLRSAGPSMSPFNAWVFLKGLETLSLRMQAHSRAAMVLAQWLLQQPGVEQVHYPGLESHPQHALAARQQRDFGGIVSFELAGGKAAAWRMIDSLELFSITANLGDTKSTVTHPATTTHGRLSEATRLEAGIVPGMVRLSVGLEDVRDLQDDLARGLAAVQGA